MEYLELYLCKEVYHCTPLELSEIPMSTINKHLLIMSTEASINKFKTSAKI